MTWNKMKYDIGNYDYGADKAIITLDYCDDDIGKSHDWIGLL